VNTIELTWSDRVTPQIFLVQNDEVIVLTLYMVIRMTLALSVNVIELQENKSDIIRYFSFRAIKLLHSHYQWMSDCELEDNGL